MTDDIFYFIQITTGTPREQCPLDTPYAFNDGTKCCHDDKDRQGNALTFTSMTCDRGLDFECPKERCISNGKILEYFLTNSQIEKISNIFKDVINLILYFRRKY